MTGHPALADPAIMAHVRAAAARSGSSFLWGMRILPKPRRDAMYAIYAFCREVDDIADEGGTKSEKLAQLDGWRAEIDRLYAGAPKRIVAKALKPAVDNFALAQEDFLAIIEGMEMDAREKMRAPDLPTLDRYCQCVAGAVGLLSIRAFGATESPARALALALGSALQLTNILRDLAEDAQMGRLYLPREHLQARSIHSADPEVVLQHPALPLVCADVAAMARDYFDQVATLLTRCRRRPLRPAIVMMMIYQRVLNRLLARGWANLDQPVVVTKLEKIWLAARYGIF